MAHILYMYILYIANLDCTDLISEAYGNVLALEANLQQFYCIDKVDTPTTRKLCAMKPCKLGHFLSNYSVHTLYMSGVVLVGRASLNAIK